MSEENPVQVTRLLNSMARGEPGASDELWRILYEELHRLADLRMARERRDHTLQPTALVHEAFVKLTKAEQRGWENRQQFFGLASEVMRQVLLDHARAKKTGKRGGGSVRVALDEAEEPATPGAGLDAQVLEEALAQLTQIDPARARIVVLRFFGGLTMQEIADSTGQPLRSVERSWQAASAWLRDRLAP